MDYSRLKDNDLANLLRKGDPYAYTEIFERYHRILLRHAFRLLNDQDEAYDVVQDVFLQLWQNHETIKVSISLSGYLYTAVKNAVFKLFAHDKVIAKYIDSIGRFLDSESNAVEDTLMEKELFSLISAEIAALPAKMREVFLLSKDEELSYKQISERLHITEQTARQQVYKAMKILKPKIHGFIHIMVLFATCCYLQKLLP